MAIDFASLNRDLLANAEAYVSHWLPAGKKRGDEWVVGGLNGDAGKSLSINLKTGIWKDFATGEGGGDLVSLYAGINALSQGEAASALGATQTLDPSEYRQKPKPVETDQLQLPPADAGLPPPHIKHGAPALTHCYRNADGAVLGYICRYDTPEGKQFAPWRWIDGKWKAKAFPKPRPLYGLELLALRPDAPVLVVEGEKSADALRGPLKGFVVVTWPGGSNAYNGTDWSPLRGRAVTVWPDNDDPGRRAMAAVATQLARFGCGLRAVNPEDDRPKGWDGADAVTELGAGLIAWCKSHVREIPVSTAAAEEGTTVDVKADAPIETVDDRSAGAADSNVSVPETVGEQPSSPPNLAKRRASAGADSQQDNGNVVQLPVARSRDHLLAIKSHQTRWRTIGITDEVMTNGRPPCNEDTVYRFCSWLGDKFWYDTFLQQMVTTFFGAPQEVTDEVLSELTVFFQSELALQKMSAERIKSGLSAWGFKNKRNVAQEWLHSLQWDGKKRLELLLPNGFGAEDDDYSAAVGKCFMIGCVRRVLQPGCQMDNVLLLEGSQGSFKSSALRILGGEWFTEQHEAVTSKDFYQNLRGKMIVEISEMSSFDRASIAKVKAVISNTKDTYRRSYGFVSGDHPRQCVFTCTTNDPFWNNDPTGARRFWRVIVGKIELEWIRENREQLFAEAVSRCLAGESHWDVPADKQKALTDDARVTDPLEDPIIRFISARDYATTNEIFEHLDIPMKDRNKMRSGNVYAILSAHGYHQKATRVGRVTFKAWHKRTLDIRGPASSPPADEGTLDDDDPELEL